MVHEQFVVIYKATDTLTIRYTHSPCLYLRLQTHTHNKVHTQSMLIPKATDTHSQYGTNTVHAYT